MFSTNLRQLRKARGESQHQLAQSLDIPRTTLAGYELGKSEPNLNMLRQIASLLNVSLDSLLTDDLSKGMSEVAKSDTMRVLAITLDAQQRENVELVGAKAIAGYAEQCRQPEFIGQLPKISLPMLRDGSYRAFTIDGDSMLPVLPGSVIICSYVEDLLQVKDGKTFVVVTCDGSVVYKRLFAQQSGNQLLAVSDNTFYPPYLIDFADILEVWQFKACLGFSDSPDKVNERLRAIEQGLERLADKLG